MSRKWTDRIVTTPRCLLGLTLALALLISMIGGTAAAATNLGTFSGTYTGTPLLYTVTVGSPGAITINGQATGANPSYFDILVFDKNYNEIDESDCVWTPNAYVNKGTFYLNTGTYIFQVSAGYITNVQFNYSLNFSSEKANESFPEPYGGNNNSISTASSIALNTTYCGLFPSIRVFAGNALNDKRDVYKFTVPTSPTKTVIKTSSTVMAKSEDNGCVNAYLYNSSGKELASRNIYFSDLTYRAADWSLSLSAGTYYLAYENDYTIISGGPYTFSVSCTTLAKPKFTSVANGNGYTKLMWSKSSAASGYYVYRRAPGGSYKKIATVTGAASVSYADKTVKAGAGYYYAVRAYSGSLLSGPNYDSRYNRYLAIPKLVSAKRYKKGKPYILVTWNKVAGADRYYLYRKAGSATTWTNLGYVSSSYSSCYDAKTKAGTKYTYTVRAWDKTGTVTSMSSYNATGVSFKP